MFAIPHLPHLLLLGLCIAFCSIVIAASMFAVRRGAVHWRTPHPTDASTGGNSRPCRYCRGGVAVLVEESIRLDGNAFVNVACYACTECGLPQWSVDRKPSSPRVL